MTEQNTPKRGWVKNAIIIFLAVMLVLVFFSNTIMNRSLPEVATQYTSSGTINTVIRGNGTATANETYEVKIDQTRTVLSTYVRVGDEVKPDTLMFKLQDSESDELGSLRQELEDAEYNYQIALLDASLGGTDQNNRDIQRAREELEAAKTELAALGEKGGNDLTEIRASISSLKSVMESKKTAMEDAQEALNALGSLNYGSDDSSAMQSINRADAALKNAEMEYQSVYLRYGSEYEILKEIGRKLTETQVGTSYSQRAYMSALAAEFAVTGGEPVSAVPNTDGVFVRHLDGLHIQFPINDLDPDSNLYFKKDLATAYEIVSSALADKEEAERSYNNAWEDYLNSSDSGNVFEYNKRKKALDEAKAAFDASNAELEEKTAFLSEYTDTRDKVYELSNQLEGLLLDQKKISVEQSRTALDLQRQQDKIEKMRETIKTMEAGGSITEVYANVSGIVRSINVSAGSKAAADTAMASIDVVDRGYSLTMPVSVEQAEKVRVGDGVEISGGGWGMKITGTLVSVRNDPNKMGQGKLLMISLTGDVESGSTYNVAIGQRSQYYDVIVPNSAIREDSNGTYVFVVEAKNSPLGNRYFASRENVTILAKDDNNAAVSGNLSGWGTSVITSAPPLTAGTQIRLAENG